MVVLFCCEAGYVTAPLNANVIISVFFFSDVEVWQKSEVVLSRGYEEDRGAVHAKVNRIMQWWFFTDTKGPSLVSLIEFARKKKLLYNVVFTFL